MFDILLLRMMRIAGLLFVVCAGAGCATETIWYQADVPTIQFGNVLGTKPVAAGSNAHVLEIEYALSTGEKAMLEITLDSDGNPSFPFFYNDAIVKGAPVWEKVSDAQRAGIFRKSILRDENAADAAVDSGMIHGDLPWRSCGGVVPEDPGPNSLVAIIYGIDSDGRVIAIPNSTRVTSLPASVQVRRTRVALVPWQCRRVPAAVQRSKTIAAILTPFAIACDAIVMPAVYLVSFLYNIDRS
ncbi:MAG TPA: hypothetical protein VFE47_16125 [Tepidisphaeraceae bacterium]|jgi:hypothetical protein|nr:hypothetical protein [Tepidisphaeraceae bacterium]